jgi:hypothetical protein
MLRAVVIAALCAMPAVAHAEDRVPLTVELGATVTKKVGYAMGYQCDDESIARGEMKNGTAEDNLFVVTGVKLGTTLCRAGTMQDRPSILFEITVVPPKPKAKAPAPAPKKK